MKYTSDLTEKQWSIIGHKIPKNSGRGRPVSVDMRDIINAVNYVLKTGAQWRNLPANFPNYSIVYYHFNKFKKDRVWSKIHDSLVMKVRGKAGRTATPTASIIDSQSVKTTAGTRKANIGFDAAKKVKGKKRHIAVDVLGLILNITVSSASSADHKIAGGFLQTLFQKFPSIKLVWADGGYHKITLIQEIQNLWGRILRIVKRPRNIKGFKVLQWRWIVERTFGWLSNFRRLAKDYEREDNTTISWMYIAMINIMSARLI